MSSESILSEFVSRTNADPSFAQDLLEATGWDIAAAITAFEGLNVTHEQHQFQDPEFILSEYDEIDLPPPPPPAEQATPTATQHEESVKKRSTKKRNRKGLTNVADEISELFLRVAVTETKLKIGAEQKEKVFDDQFFKHSFLRPDFSKESDDFQKFISHDITENSHKHVLEKSGRLNWWSTTGKLPTLEPLATSGDGNCLLHAASMYMWGLPDQNLILRTHLHRLLTQSLERKAIHRRWKYSTEIHNLEAGGLTFSEEEWEFEWHEIIRIATNQPRRRPTTNSLRRYSTLRPHYESLEEIHVFGLAHVLHRPVIVIADEYLRNMEGEPIAPIYFGGIYLPFEISPASCFKSPLILAYESSHFSPLVAKRDPNLTERHKNSRFRHMQSKQDTVIPLVDPEGSLLPLLFSFDPDKPNLPERWSRTKCPPGDFPDEIRTLLESYMDIRWIQLDIGSKFGSNNEMMEEGRLTIPMKIPKVRFPAAVVSNIGEPEYQSQLVEKYLEDVKKRFEEDKIKQEKIASDKARQIEEMKKIEAARPKPCKGVGCTLYGTANTDYYCSQCYAKAKNSPAVIRSTSVPSPPFKKDDTTPRELIIKQEEEWDVIPSSDIAPSQGRRGYPSSPATKPTKPTTTVNDTTVDDIDTALLHPSGGESSSQSSSDAPPKVPPKKSKQLSPSKAAPTTPPKTTPISPPKTTPPPRPNPPPNKVLSNRSRGYSRDYIKPITESVTNQCLAPDCTFHGSKDGYCSQCYIKLHSSITQV